MRSIVASFDSVDVLEYFCIAVYLVQEYIISTKIKMTSLQGALHRLLRLTHAFMVLFLQALFSILCHIVLFTFTVFFFFSIAFTYFQLITLIDSIENLKINRTFLFDH